MRDPFKPNSNRQLVREAQFGFTVIGLLVATLIYVAWFRISGQNERTPEHVRNSPVAMQVYPSSPNYDRETHRMTSEDSPSFVANPIRSETSSNPALVSAPRRILEDSNRTVRSLRDAAESIEQSANKVATLSSTTETKKQFDLVSNPAIKSSADSGFKALKTQGPTEDIKKIPSPDRHAINRLGMGMSFRLTDGNPAKDSSSSLLEPTNVEQPKLEQQQKTFPPKLILPKTDAQPPKPNTFLPKPESDPATLELSNDFKPSAFKPTPTTPILESETFKLAPGETQSATTSAPLITPNPFDKPIKSEAVGDAPTQAIPRLPKLPEQSFLNLRDNKTSTAEVQTKPVIEIAGDVPKVQTVSFEQTTWTVEQGDSFWSIAQSHYGDGRFFRALYEQNRKLVPGFENLTTGVEIDLPSTSELVRKFPTLCPSDALRKDDKWRETPDDLMENLTDACEADLNQRLYETKAEDTLFGIARRKLGQASRYVELIELNQYLIDAKLTHDSELPPGIQLLLPNE